MLLFSVRRRMYHTECILSLEMLLFVGSGNLLQCLQTPLQDLRNWLRPNMSSACSSRIPQIESSVADREISYIDDSSADSSSNGSTNSRSCSSSTSSSNSAYDDDAYPSTPMAEPSLSSATSSVPHTARAFSSDSGFVRLKTNITTMMMTMKVRFRICFFIYVIQIFLGDRRS